MPCYFYSHSDINKATHARQRRFLKLTKRHHGTLDPAKSHFYTHSKPKRGETRSCNAEPGQATAGGFGRGEGGASGNSGLNFDAVEAGGRITALPIARWRLPGPGRVHMLRV